MFSSNASLSRNRGRFSWLAQVFAVGNRHSVNSIVGEGSSPIGGMEVAPVANISTSAKVELPRPVR